MGPLPTVSIRSSPIYVLILILMEVPQWVPEEANVQNPNGGLNPYSNGSTTMGGNNYYRAAA